MRLYGLIGKKLEHSLSKKYFEKKFLDNNIKNIKYINIELESIDNLKDIIKDYKLSGLKITIPYKISILNHIDKIDLLSKKVGSINTIKISNNKIIGFNTDLPAFINSIKPILKNRENALILGDGGVAQSIKSGLEILNIKYITISRKGKYNYEYLNKENIKEFDIIINATPLGMYPNINSYPNIPYEYINKNCLLYDTVYNPELTKFLKFGKKYGCDIKNGLEMLHLQADYSWEFWNK